MLQQHELMVRQAMWMRHQQLVLGTSRALSGLPDFALERSSGVVWARTILQYKCMS